MLSEAEHLTAEQRFRQAFDRLKTDTPRVLKPGTPVSQNNVALEAGVVTSALRKSRFPSLIREIQAYVDLGQPATRSKRQTQLKQRKARADLKQKLADVKAQRDHSQSQLVSVQRRLVEISMKLKSVQAQLDELRPPPTPILSH